MRYALLPAAILLTLSGCGGPAPANDPLPSWNDGAVKQSILRFVREVTEFGGHNYVAPAARVATFDNDGTLWVEQPLYVQILFAAAEMKALAPRHPEWKDNANFQKIINGDANAIFQLAPADQFAVGFAVHAGRSVEEYSASAKRWLEAAQHPRFRRPYTQLAYQPMLELIAYLRANQFQVYSVTGAEIGFVRVANEESFGIPRDHVIATLLKTKFDNTTKPAELLALPDVLLIDDGDGKPASINNVTGRRPIAAFGNSDGDLSMLQWTASGPGARLAVVVHHDDAAREFAYDRASPVGHLDKALNEAAAQGWNVISMKTDWKRIFAGQP